MTIDWTYDPDLPIDTVMRKWPATLQVLLRHRMLCIGCPIGGFHTIPEVCKEHGVDEAGFVAELAMAIMDSPAPLPAHRATCGAGSPRSA